MARYDKYDPKVGGFRAPLAANRAKTSEGPPVPVALDVNGRVVEGAGVSGVVGVMITTKDLNAGDIVDVMTSGEIVEFAGVPGTVYTAPSAGGAINNTAPGAGRVRIGYTVEGTRLIVRMGVPA